MPTLDLGDLEEVDYDPFKRKGLLDQQYAPLPASEGALSPQEQNLYNMHLRNLVGPGGIDNPDGSRSTLRQMSTDIGGKTYNLPTVWDGQELSPSDSVARAKQYGLDKFPSYGSPAEAESRYQRLHPFLEEDVNRFKTMPAYTGGPIRKEPIDLPPDLTAAARAGKLGTLTGGGDSWSNNLAGGFSNAVGALGATPQGQRNAYEFAGDLSSIIPGVSNVLSGNQAYRDFGEGNYLSGLLNTAAAVPIPGAGLLEKAGVKAATKEGLTLYHGSKADIDKFNFNKMADTGEMTQGHGIYFSDHPDVAKDYNFGDPNGNLYEVNINHHPDEFIKWDDGMDAQHPNVRRAFDKLGVGDAETGYDAHQALVDQFMESGKYDDEWSASKAVSKKLHKEGVPGIRYQDFETEVPGENHNYVMFGDKNIEIKSKRRPGEVASKSEQPAPIDYPGMLSELGPGWEKAPVINQAGDFLHGDVTMDSLNQNLAMLNDEGKLSKGILSYHGTPHEFNKFDFGKIGTGEGAQVYGHGLYFAEHPDVAEGYRTAGTQDTGKLFDPQGSEVNLPVNNNDPENIAHQFVKYGGSFEKGHEWIDTIYGGEFGDAAHAHLDEMEKSGWTIQGPGKGSKYQVAIKHDPDTFFDLDKKFSEQHPDVQKAANDIFGRKFHEDMSGQDVHDFLTTKMEKESNTLDEAPVRLTERLREKGVPGVRYLDEGSRDVQAGFNPSVKLNSLPPEVRYKVQKLVPNADLGDTLADVHSKLWGNTLNRSGVDSWTRDISSEARDQLLKIGVPSYVSPKTRNYVTFDDKNVKILKRLGAAGALTLGGTGSVLAHPWMHKDLNAYQIDDDDGQ